MSAAQCTKSSNTHSIAIRFDTMSMTRMAWIAAQFPEFNPSRSFVVRRAVQHYLQHLEDITKDSGNPSRLEYETLLLKSCGQGEESPWEHDPDFSRRTDMTLTELLKEFRTNRSKGDINRFLGSSPFKAKADRMVRAKP
ncbi:MAG TPA: hypothetical protein VFK88_09565 [Gallionella sp.]|nr:hypothetical protein [Gallionella sp.]